MNSYRYCNRVTRTAIKAGTSAIVVVAREEVAERMEGVASGRREGEISFEIVEKHVTPELAYLVEMERAKAKFGAGEDVTSYAPRATVIYLARRRCLEGHASARIRPRPRRPARRAAVA